MKTTTVFAVLVIVALVSGESNSIKKSKDGTEKRQLALPSILTNFLATLPTIATIWAKLIALAKLPLAAFIYTKAVAVASALFLKTKPIALAIGAVYSTAFILGLLFPSAQSIFATPTTTFRQMTDYVGGFSNFFQFDGVDRVIRVLDFTDTTFDYIGVKEASCREKAACELGFYLAKEYPSAATVIRVMGDEAPTKYGPAFLKGTNLENCEKVYSNCHYSPSQRYFT